MKDNKYWILILFLELVLISTLLDLSIDLVKQGLMWVGYAIRLGVLLFIFYKIAKNFNELIK